MSTAPRSSGRRLLFLSTLTLLSWGAATVGHGQSGAWTSAANGDYNTPGNWAGNTIASGAGNTADFSTLDLPGDVSVTLNANLTIGNMLFGDTDNAGSPGSWELRTDNDPIPTITLDNNGASPVITVNPLGPTMAGFDDAFIGHQLAGTAGLTKAGAGTLSIGASASALTGPINVNAGTLRFASAAATYAGATAPITLANNTVLEHLGAGAFFGNVKVASGGSATIRMLGGGSNFLNAIQGQGTGETLNLEFGVSGATYSGEGDWATGGFAAVNMTGLDAAGRSNFRGRINRPAPNNFNANAFANAKLNLDNVSFLFQTNSGGNNVVIGELSGTATASLTGGNNGSGGSAPRYVIGGMNTDSTFAGAITGNGGPVSPGTGGLSIDKVGTGKLTLSGALVGPLVGNNADIGRQGGVIRVSQGTLALAGAADNIPGGFGTFKSTVAVLAGATLDVSGTTNVFTSSPLLQFQGSGTVIGPFNHVAGEIRPADVATVDNDSALTNLPVATVGTINFNGQLSFNGGTIVYDMNPTPGVNDLISVTGLTNLGSGAIIQPNFLGADPAPGQTYTVLNSSGGFAGSTAGWSVAWPGRGVKPAVVTNGNLLQFTTTAVGAVGSIVWSGATDGDWDIQGKQNWTNGGSPDTYFEGDNVRFDDTGANPAINVVTSVSPTSMVVDSSTNNYSFTGNSITSVGSLTKRGSSTLTLGATNEFSGGAVIEGGTVDVGAVNNTLGTGQLTVAGASIVSAGGQIGNSGLAVTAATTNTIQADGGAGSAAAFSIPVLSGGGNLAINSATEDKWFSSGVTSAFTGQLSVGPNNGAVQLGNWRGRGGQTSFPNAVVTLNATSFANQQAGTGEVTFAFGELHGDLGSSFSGFVGGSTSIPNVNWEIGNLNTNSDFAGAINDGAGGSGAVAVSRLTKVGSGRLDLTGINGYTGDTTIDGGTLSITNAYLSDTADVFVASGALFDLAFVGEDIIDSLYLGGTPQAVGTYGAVGNASAMFQTAFITGTGILNVSTLGTSLGTPGDFNNDGFVDAADYTTWRDNLATNNALPNDNGLGAPVAQAHYDLWKSNFGNPASGGALGAVGGAVPEPSTLAMLGLLLAGVAVRRGLRG